MKIKNGICENPECKKPFFGKDYRQVFCSRTCAVKISNLKRSENPEYVKKNKEQIIALNKSKSGIEWSKKIGNSSNRKKRSDTPKNIFDCSSRTRIKILKRLNVCCCVCGWNEGTCDVHHIKGKKIDDYNNHNNLSVLCPNHHRLIHEGKISVNDIKSFEDQYSNTWIEQYYF